MIGSYSRWVSPKACTISILMSGGLDVDNAQHRNTLTRKG